MYVLMKWTQPSSHMSLTRGTMGGVARKPTLISRKKGGGCYGHHDIGD